MLLSLHPIVCQHCGGSTAFRQWGDVVEFSGDDMLVTYRAVCTARCPGFQQTAESTVEPGGEYSVWESRY